METNFLEWIGFLASLIIAISMTLSSIVKFRWINLIGALTFSVYGFLIGSIPVGLLNAFIVVVDVYYLIKFYGKKEVFENLEIQSNNKYLLQFLEYNNPEIQKCFPGFSYKPTLNTISYFVLRNMSIAGLFLAQHDEKNVLNVELDFVLPQFRDFKSGKYFYQWLSNNFINQGFTTVETKGYSTRHINYLKKIGFEDQHNGVFKKNL